ncbi:MAG TPA: ABC transporter permease subunit [Vicinamibacterales bacterium]|jgi:sodium transport system permease protein
MSPCFTIAFKEIRDHVRDTRSLLSAAMYALMGPVVILLVSQSPLVARGGTRLLLSMMSVFTLVSAFTGGMFIALDSTAGERERGSLVPLLLNPVSRMRLIVGKWIAVAGFALAGLALNLTAFTAIFEWRGVNPPGQVRLVFLLWIVAGLVPLTLFGAALDLLTGAASRTTKDGHTRLSLVMLVPMMVGMFLVFFPSWIGRWWFAVPVVGQQALIGIGLQGETVPLWRAGALALLTTATAFAALWAAARALARDETVVA